MNKTNTIHPYMLLEIKDFEPTHDFFEFLLRNKKYIYLAIFETFKGFTVESQMEKLRLSIKVLTDNPDPLIFHFDLSLNDRYMLSDLLMPYFIDESEFEICEKITKTIQLLDGLKLTQ